MHTTQSPTFGLRLKRHRRAAGLTQEELAEQIGMPGRIGWTLTKLGRIHLLKGEWGHARAIFERALRLLGDDPRSAAHSRIHLGQLDLLEGNWEAGSAQVEAAMQAEGPGRDLWLRWHGNRLLVEQDLLDSQPAAALARLKPLVEQTAGRKPRGNIMFTLLFARWQLEPGRMLKRGSSNGRPSPSSSVSEPIRTSAASSEHSLQVAEVLLLPPGPASYPRSRRSSRALHGDQPPELPIVLPAAACFHPGQIVPAP